MRAANHSAARARAAAAKRKTFEKSIEQPGGYRSPNACRSGAEAGLIGAYQDLRNSPATGYARMIVCHNSSTIRVGSATAPITASAFRARTGLVSARGAPSLCSLGPEVAIIRKKGRGIVLWRRYARVGDYGPFLRSRCELLCGGTRRLRSQHVASGLGMDGRSNFPIRANHPSKSSVRRAIHAVRLQYANGVAYQSQSVSRPLAFRCNASRRVAALVARRTLNAAGAIGYPAAAALR